MRTMEDLAYDLDRISEAAAKAATKSSFFDSIEKHNGKVALLGAYATVLKDLSNLMLEKKTPDQLIRFINNYM